MTNCENSGCYTSPFGFNGNSNFNGNRNSKFNDNRNNKFNGSRNSKFNGSRNSNFNGSGRGRPLYTWISLFHWLRVQFLGGFACGHALGYDQAAGFYAQFGQGSSEPDRADHAGYSSGGDGDGCADAVG